MKKSILSVIPILLVFVLGCGDNNPKRPTMYLTVLEDAGAGASGVTVKVYSSAQQWLDGTAPLTTLNTNASGLAETTMDFGTLTTLTIFAERSDKNNWHTILTMPGIPKGSDGIFAGSVSITESLFAQFESASTKTFLLTDFRNSSGVSVFNSLSACSKDNFIKLGINQKMTINESTLVCPGEQAQKVIDITVGHNKAASQASHNGQIMYSFPPTGQTYQVFVNSGFQKIYLFENGNEAEYTRQ